MPGSLHAWYSPYDLRGLGQRHSHLSGEIELRRLVRLRELLHTDRGSVKASLKFGQQSGLVTVDLKYEVNMQLLCQRCLEPFVRPLREHAALVVVDPESTTGTALPGYEPVALLGGRLQPAILIEDELIVSLPLIPRHSTVEECGTLAHDLETLAAEAESGRVSPPLRSH